MSTVQTRGDGDTVEEHLKQGPLDKLLNISEKKLTLESDRTIVFFLERQVRLLGLPAPPHPSATSASEGRVSSGVKGARDKGRL